MPRTLIMSPACVRRTVTRLAYEVIERNRGGTNLMVFGIPKSGLAMAVMILAALSKIVGHSVIVHKIDITPFLEAFADCEDAAAGWRRTLAEGLANVECLRLTFARSGLPKALDLLSAGAGS